MRRGSSRCRLDARLGEDRVDAFGEVIHAPRRPRARFAAGSCDHVAEARILGGEGGELGLKLLSRLDVPGVRLGPQLDVLRVLPLKPHNLSLRDFQLFPRIILAEALRRITSDLENQTDLTNAGYLDPETGKHYDTLPEGFENG